MKIPKFVIKLSVSLLVAFSSLSAQTTTVATDPVGYVTVDFSGGSIGSPTINSLSLPLYSDVEALGIISSLTSTELADSNANWTPDEFASPSTPYFVRITSGAGIGRILLIISNTVDTLNLDTEGVNLNNSVSVGDTYEIFLGDTISSVFSGPGSQVIGGTTSEGAANEGIVDIVYVLSGSGWSRYFYNIDNLRWERPGLSFFGDQGNVVIPPNGGFLYERVGPSYQMILPGRVPTQEVKSVIPSSGTFHLAINSPIGDTLGSLEIQNIPNWRSLGQSGVTINDVDLVYVLNNGWARYYYDSNVNKWFIPGLSFFGDQSSVSIHAAQSIIISRFGELGGFDVFTHLMPY